MPEKGTDIILNRLFTNIVHSQRLETQGVVDFLDAEKAFDSVKWGTCVQSCTGLSLEFYSWEQFLYTVPMARVQTKCISSSPFPLQHGTRQGCLLSLGTFALAKKLLALLLHSSTTVQNILVRPLIDELSIYANNTML